MAKNSGGIWGRGGVGGGIRAGFSAGAGTGFDVGGGAGGGAKLGAKLWKNLRVAAAAVVVGAAFCGCFERSFDSARSGESFKFEFDGEKLTYTKKSNPAGAKNGADLGGDLGQNAAKNPAKMDEDLAENSNLAQNLAQNPAAKNGKITPKTARNGGEISQNLAQNFASKSAQNLAPNPAQNPAAKTAQIPAPRPYALVFFTKDCGVCVAQIAVLNEMKKQLEFDFFFVLSDAADAADARAWAAQKGADFELFYEKRAAEFLSRAVGGIYGVPVSVFFAADGTPRRKFIGLTPHDVLAQAANDLL